VSKPTCAVVDCEAPAVARGWCNKHYLRWSHHGDPLGGKPGPSVRRAVDHFDGTRECTGCGEAKPLESFPKDKNASKGRKSRCKTCHTAGQSARYHADPERHRTRIRAQRQRDIETIREREKARYERDKPKRLALAKAGAHNRRALLAQVVHEPGISVEALRKRDGRKCHFCKITMSFKPVPNGSYVPNRATLEHLTPISRGGSHTWVNVVLACWQCNVRKNRSMDGEWEGSQFPTLPLH
jgi:5-methylcytosine-specific restriction endonuclease McrA